MNIIPENWLTRVKTNYPKQNCIKTPILNILPKLDFAYHTTYCGWELCSIFSFIGDISTIFLKFVKMFFHTLLHLADFRANSTETGDFYRVLTSTEA